ncbi:MAG TPA: efflux RND transporter permease subunit [Chthoniobacterales bacterium]|jgi:multidrug efflux pump|nr:efflux RND transporter permease subunit [Chthoniobacterales bacterium]
MNFTDIFIRRPVLAWVVNILILLGGFQALRNLNVRQYPKSDISVITVTTAYYGANADLVRGFITTPLEQSIASAEGIDYMTSESVLGTSTISVHLKLNYDTNAAMTQVQTKVNQVRNQLPPASQLPVIQIASVDNRFASMYLSFYSKDLDRNQITDYLTRVVQPKLSAINGVQQAEILGARVFAMRIWLKSDRMAALNISPTQIQNILQANNYLSAAGQTKGSMTAINLVANTDLQSVEDFKQLAIKQSNGAIVRLRDVADVELGAQSYDSDVRFSGNTATFMGIFVLPTANALDVIKSVRAALPEIQKQLPTGMELDIPYDSTEYISSAIHDVTETLIETLCIVVIVIFLFMGSLRAVIAPVLAIPVSLIGAIFLMLLFGFTLNLLTLLAIVLAVGLVVDDAIVVVENVERHLQEGMTPTNAALKGARELFGPIIAMTITLAAVYAPIGIQGGLTGTLFREFAFTLAGAVIVSGVVALTLSPMLASRLLKPGFTERGLAGWITRRFDALRGGYTHLLSGLLGVYPVIIVFSVILWPLMFVFLAMSKNELAPKEDQGVIFGIVQSAPDSTLDQTMLFARDVNDVFKSFPETAQTFQVTPIPGPGFSGLVAKPWKDRNRTMDQLLPEVTKKMAAIPGVNVLATVPPALPGGGNFPVEMVVLSTAEPREMMDFSNQLLTAANKSGKFFFADSDLKYDQPQTRIVFDRDKVAAMGLNLQQVGGDLTTLLSSGYVNYFSIQGRSYQVIPQLKRAERLTPADLANRYVTGPNGTQIQLSTIAHLEREVQPETLNHFQQLNSFTISGANGFGASIDDSLKVLEDEAAKILPRGYTIDYADESRQLRKEGNAFFATMILSLIVIYLVLAAQFESFRDPWIILLGSVPLGLVGAMAFCFLGFTSMNIYSQVGLITLVGLVSKNGILIVEFANKLQEQGRDKLHAIVEACGTRLRPILMTSVATVSGHFLLMFVTGPGAGARNSIGRVLVPGMIIGTFFTLFVVPSIYLFLAKNHSKDRERRGETPKTEERKLQPALA